MPIGIILSSVSIPETVETIPVWAFAQQMLTAVDIAHGVKSIEDYAFFYCTSLESITLPSSVETISEYAFDTCNTLTTINVNAAEGSISGAPWGATNATVNWLG